MQVGFSMHVNINIACKAGALLCYSSKGPLAGLRQAFTIVVVISSTIVSWPLKGYRDYLPGFTPCGIACIANCKSPVMPRL